MTTTMNAIPVEDVGRIWQRWQNANASEAETVRETFADMAIRRGFELANNWLVCKIHEQTTLPKHLIREYQRKHRRAL